MNQVRLLAFANNENEDTQKAREWLRKHDIDYELFNLSEKKPTQAEMERWLKECDFKKSDYIDPHDEEDRRKADDMDDKELASWLVSHLDKIHLPILEVNHHAKIFGFVESKYKEFLC